MTEMASPTDVGSHIAGVGKQAPSFQLFDEIRGRLEAEFDIGPQERL